MAKKKKTSENAEELFTMRMKSSQKEIWERFIKGSNKRFTKLSQLIRYCVNGYMNGYLIENVDQNKVQLEKLLNEKKILYDDEISKLNEAVNEMKELLLNQIVEPTKTIKDEVAKGQFLTALKKANYTSKELSKMFNYKHENVIPQLTSLIKEDAIGRNENNEYYLKKQEE